MPTLAASGVAVALAQTTPPAISTPVAFADLPGFADDDLAAAFAVFRTSCTALLGGIEPLRAAQPAPAALTPVCHAALALPAPLDRDRARAFFEAQFEPRRIGAAGSAFFTGYYEPVVAGSLEPTATMRAPLYGPPPGLVPVPPGTRGLDPGLTTALARPDGTLVALPDRAGIEGGALGASAPAIAYVHDGVEAFFIQIQGSARLQLPDGRLRRLVYAGRNGYPYASIGRELAQRLAVPPAQMGMAQIKAWIRAHGEGPGEAGTRLMQTNRSFIFFRFDDSLPPDVGPTGGSGVGVTGLRSLAVDRAVWAYGLPMYAQTTVAGPASGEVTLHRLMIAQDTGSAIVGPARADIFFGTGAEAAHRAGATRAHGTLYVLWPKAMPTPGATP